MTRVHQHIVLVVVFLILVFGFTAYVTLHHASDADVDAVPNSSKASAAETVEAPESLVRSAIEAGFAPDVSEHIDSLIYAGIAARAFPAAAVAVGRGNDLVHLRGYGHFTYTSTRPVTGQSVFDIASLTKVVATTTAIMRLYEDERIDLDAPAAQYVPRFGVNGKQHVTIRQLLSHSAGLPPFVPFHLHGVTQREAVLNAILTQPPIYAPGSDFRYSDHGFIVLALIVEAVSGKSFDVFVQEEIFEPLGMQQTGFRPSAAVADSTVIPTEMDNAFRRRLIQGEVHDETAWILGGASGHAGLFSTAEDLARFALMLVNDGQLEGVQFLQPETIALFTTPVDRSNPSFTRALGWDTRSAVGYSSAGQYFGPRSYGHTGFTGTSMWIDPDHDLFVILLTNRVYPSRNNPRLAPIRAQLADIVYTAIIGPPDMPVIRATPRRGARMRD